VALGRARDLYEAGHLKAALAALDGVSEADPLAPDATRLRTGIQRILLESAVAVSSPASAPTPAAPGSRPSEVRR